MDVLKIRNLTVAFHTEMGELTAVKGVDLTLKQGEILGLVGESGCGKTVLCKSMLHLLCNRGTVKTGQALLDDVDLLTRNEKEMEQLRGKEVAMIFQDPMTSLNPSVSIGKQIEEVLFLHEKVTKL
ncbi:MAG: ATP-binding cassette domain-containing protein, partial [Anaerovorax sp.]